MFRSLQARHPDVLLIPEHESYDYWTATAPYGELGTKNAATPSEAAEKGSEGATSGGDDDDHLHDAVVHRAQMLVQSIVPYVASGQYASATCVHPAPWLTFLGVLSGRMPSSDEPEHVYYMQLRSAQDWALASVHSTHASDLHASGSGASWLWQRITESATKLLATAISIPVSGATLASSAAQSVSSAVGISPSAPPTSAFSMDAASGGDAPAASPHPSAVNAAPVIAECVCAACTPSAAPVSMSNDVPLIVRVPSADGRATMLYGCVWLPGNGTAPPGQPAPTVT
ncbi:hypothetical protein EON66_05660 [archaeon]|nr:MAG: hypothetical protein EON66_05660 [archaeon]